MKLAAFLAGVACGIGVCLWWIARGIATPVVVNVVEPKRPESHDLDNTLPPFDPHLWRERMR